MTATTTANDIKSLQSRASLHKLIQDLAHLSTKVEELLQSSDGEVTDDVEDASADLSMTEDELLMGLAEYKDKASEMAAICKARKTFYAEKASEASAAMAEYNKKVEWAEDQARPLIEKRVTPKKRNFMLNERKFAIRAPGKPSLVLTKPIDDIPDQFKRLVQQEPSWAIQNDYVKDILLTSSPENEKLRTLISDFAELKYKPAKVTF